MLRVVGDRRLISYDGNYTIVYFDNPMATDQKGWFVTFRGQTIASYLSSFLMAEKVYKEHKKGNNELE